MHAPVEVRDIALIQAPLDRVWSLSTQVELVRSTLGMEMVSGPAGGFITDGSRVVWQGWKFGLPTRHHTLITGFAAPHPAEDSHAQTLSREAWFQDSQERGRFAFFQHDHVFRELRSETDEPVTLLGDHVQFSLPWAIGGAIAANLLMKAYVARLVRRRFAVLKELAEGDGWRAWMQAG